jgi:hypothetical protein
MGMIECQILRAQFRLFKTPCRGIFQVAGFSGQTHATAHLLESPLGLKHQFAIRLDQMFDRFIQSYCLHFGGLNLVITN